MQSRGDFNLGHIDWNIPSVVPSKPDPSLHQNVLDILNDHNLTQVMYSLEIAIRTPP
jgi:hypothetical protein